MSAKAPRIFMPVAEHDAYKSRVEALLRQVKQALFTQATRDERYDAITAIDAELGTK